MCIVPVLLIDFISGGIQKCHNHYADVLVCQVINKRLGLTECEGLKLFRAASNILTGRSMVEQHQLKPVAGDGMNCRYQFIT